MNFLPLELDPVVRIHGDLRVPPKLQMTSMVLTHMCRTGVFG